MSVLTHLGGSKEGCEDGDRLERGVTDSALGVDQGGHHRGRDVLEVELVAGEGEEPEHDHVEDGLPHHRLLVAQVVQQVVDDGVGLHGQHQLLQHLVVLNPHHDLGVVLEKVPSEGS